MPRWARFLSCTFTALLLSLCGFLLAAYLTEHAPHFWSGLQAFLATADFWSLVLLFGLMAAAGLMSARAVVNLYGLPDPLSGFLAGSAPAVCYVALLLASQLSAWGGWHGAWPRVWPAAVWLILPFALAGAVANWLWARLG